MSVPPEGARVLVRTATDADIPAILALASRALGWEADDATAAHFAWKHVDNPFGRSDLWVAQLDGEIVGVRSVLRWELVGPDGRVHRAARTVDTATDEQHRRQGIFTRLTTAALDVLAADGVDLIFNTPNDQSRPANLTLGWQVVGRLPAVVRPTGARGLAALLRARAPAARGALACDAGRPAPDVLGDADRAAALAARRPPSRGLATHRTPAYLAWRYGHPALHYRVVEDAGAVVVFHLRRRGPAVEAVVCDTFPAPGSTRVPTAMFRRIAGETGAHYLLGLAAPLRPAGGFWPVPGAGPVLTVRGISVPAPAARSAWDLTMGDIEGF